MVVGGEGEVSHERWWLWLVTYKLVVRDGSCGWR